MKTILIIDDERRIREIYKKVIKTASPIEIRILEADNAEEATEFLIREELNLVLLDINMPHIKGDVMADVIREYNPHLKVIVASVYPIEHQKRLIPYATEYYDKSLNLIKFLEKITDMLKEESGSIQENRIENLIVEKNFAQSQYSFGI
jgi:YesN/AraC family two-component response regulator